MRDSDRGLLCADDDGDAAGDDASTGCGGPPKRLRTVSSSDDVLISTSLRSEERNEGPTAVGGGD